MHRNDRPIKYSQDDIQTIKIFCIHDSLRLNNPNSGKWQNILCIFLLNFLKSKIDNNAMSCRKWVITWYVCLVSIFFRKSRIFFFIVNLVCSTSYPNFIYTPSDTTINRLRKLFPSQFKEKTLFNTLTPKDFSL